jgi:IPT/TIG domain
MPPQITAVTPSWSPLAGGQIVNIFGYGFAPSSYVRFNFTNAQFHQYNSTQLFAVSPPWPQAGFVTLVVADFFSHDIATYPYFRYVAPLPPGAVRVLAPSGGQVFQAGQPITVVWETAFGPSRHAVRLLIAGRPPITVNDRLAGAARSYVFYAPNPGTSPVQATVQVIAYDSVGQSASANSQPFTITPAPKTKENKEFLIDKGDEKQREIQ